MELKTFTNQELGCTISGFGVDNQIWFKGKDVATCLGYIDTDAAIRNSVDNDEKAKLEELLLVGALPAAFTKMPHHTIFINESGLYALTFSSHKSNAKLFRKWVTKEVLPSIRTTGSYTLPTNTPSSSSNSIEPTIEDCQERINKWLLDQDEKANEKEEMLHKRYVAFVRQYFPGAIIIPGLGELQKSPTHDYKHIAWELGYTGGQPDVIIANKNVTYTGLVMEFKRPNGDGRLQENQKRYLHKLRTQGYQIIVTKNYTHAVVKTVEYFRSVGFECSICEEAFSSEMELELHTTDEHPDWSLDNDDDLKIV